MKAVKYGIGSVLLLFALLYLGVLVLVSTGDRNDSGLRQEPWLKVTYVGCEQLGNTLENSSGEILEAYEDYTYYRLLFEIENRGNGEYWGAPSQALYIDGHQYDDVWEVYEYPYEYEYDSDKLFSSYEEQTLPGKTRVSSEIYVMVRDGVDELMASYHEDWENWDEAEKELQLSLSRKIL